VAEEGRGDEGTGIRLFKEKRRGRRGRNG